MYAAIYSYYKDNGKRIHLGNVTNITHKTTRKVFDLNSSSVKGFATFGMDDALICVINEEDGTMLYSGFIKNTKVHSIPLGSSVEFQVEDFRKILDTDVLLDFSQEISPSHSLQSIFEKVKSSIFNDGDPIINELNISFSVPEVSLNTKEISDYTGQYFITNGLKFLKVYLSYYRYYLSAKYDVVNDVILFEFRQQPVNIVEIKLDDFLHEKSSPDIKINKTIATISFSTDDNQSNPQWEDSTESYYDSQEESLKSFVVGSNPPSPNGYSQGFALAITNELIYEASLESDYDSAKYQANHFVSILDSTCPATAPSFSECKASLGDVNQYQLGTVFRCAYRTSNYDLCVGNYTYIKILPGNTISYFKLTNVGHIARPDLPKKIYTLGKNNEIYEGYAPLAERILPINQKICEAQYLYEAQINAVYELINNRYVENIIIDETDSDNLALLRRKELFTIVKVYDQDNLHKEIPISEITTNFDGKTNNYKIKLGFKKTLLTEIIKSDIGEEEVVKAKKIAGNSTFFSEVFEPILSTEDAPQEVGINQMFFKEIV